MLNLIRKAAAK
jgi:methylmalonyl-CoA mutase